MAKSHFKFNLHPWIVLLLYSNMADILEKESSSAKPVSHFLPASLRVFNSYMYVLNVHAFYYFEVLLKYMIKPFFLVSSPEQRRHTLPSQLNLER